MLHRADPDGPIVITQPAHAWVSGQLAQAWGNESFGEFAPREEVCLAAEQHDIGWLVWEEAPTLNPATGRPYAFRDMPITEHLAVWSGAAETMLLQSRYAALLVSMHITWLYQKFPRADASAAEKRAIQGFLDRQHALQRRLLRALQADRHYASVAVPEVVERNRRLVGLWDWMSLLLCGGLWDERTVADIPTAEGSTTVALRPQNPAGSAVTVRPWPFRKDQVTLVTEGRRLPRTFTDEQSMRTALAEAPAINLILQLQPN